MKNQQLNIVAIDINAVKSRMLQVRGQQVLLDRDVAELYGVETKAVNQAVKRNAERFFDGYILTLTAEECSRSQIVTLNGKRGSNIKYLPHAFTEKGLYMLATVLKSDSAIQATHAIIETYAEVRAVKRELLALHTETDAKKRKSMMQHFGEVLNAPSGRDRSGNIRMTEDGTAIDSPRREWSMGRQLTTLG